MKKIILTAVVFVAFAQAENIVHYDKKTKADSSVSKPNHPNSDIHVPKK